MKKTYHVGELARYFGVSNDTLRLYDKKGILSPGKDGENGYRVYSRADLLCLEYILRLKQTGLGLETIRTLVNEGSLDFALKVAEEQSRRLEEQVRRLRLLQEMTADYQRSLRVTIDSLDRIQICQSPRMICRPLDALVSETSMIQVMADFQQLAPGRLPQMSYFSPPERFFADTYEEELATADASSWGLIHVLILVDEENQVQVPPELRPRFQVLEPRACVFGSVKCYTGQDYSAYSSLRQYVLEHDLRLCDYMISIAATVRNNNQASVDYYQVWMPVAPRDAGEPTPSATAGCGLSKPNW